LGSTWRWGREEGGGGAADLPIARSGETETAECNVLVASSLMNGPIMTVDIITRFITAWS